jgi:hypothetical protein
MTNDEVIDLITFTQEFLSFEAGYRVSVQIMKELNVPQSHQDGWINEYKSILQRRMTPLI